ncbi:cyclic nucleotide-binding domain protein (macronuclear) [Tetrahymena thermophila SB210]|uniref:Cyclic nucleotide-binding domain protein n=1 Tax=Tetrahymena thermophila (strain SB210) TaxID=312017 RepID=I7M4P6_TETTS|nr:cyclic nucleotide-binding domain protein [Tetrahymena thermophila SB210]EAS07793.2 cyclic nucleotide-binding domain protein [Tetrahymena thermophila SB210]|eukprot:XP_001028035.2 cyclic nucleotide-binding domain protein [Tetrahymena thermophila SB210]
MDSSSNPQEKQNQLRELLMQTSLNDNLKINLVQSETNILQKIEEQLDSQDNTKRNVEKLSLKRLSLLHKDGFTPKRQSIVKSQTLAIEQSEKQKTIPLKKFRKAALGIQFANALGSELYDTNKRLLQKTIVDISDPIHCQLVIDVLKKKQRTKKEIDFISKAVSNLNFFETKKQELDQKLYEQLFASLSYEFFQKEEVIYHHGDQGKKYYIILKGSCSLLVPNTQNENFKSSNLVNFQEEFQKLKEKYDQCRNNSLLMCSPQLKSINFSPKIKALNLSPNQKQHIPRVIQSIQEIQEGDLHGNDFHQVQQNRQNQMLYSQPLSKKQFNESSSFVQQRKQENNISVAIQNSAINGDFKKSEQSSPLQPLQKTLSTKNIPKLDHSLMSNNTDNIANFINYCFPDFNLTCNFKQGDSFGDVALLTRSKQQGTVVCQEDTHIMSLSKEAFDRILGEQQKQIVKNNIRYLKQFSFLENIPDSTLMNLMNYLKQVHYQKGEIIYDQFDPSSYLYFIKSGEIELSQIVEFPDNHKEEVHSSQNVDEKTQKQKFPTFNHIQEEKLKQKNLKRVKFALIGANNCFGEKEIIQNTPRTQMAKCISQVADIYCLSRELLISYLKLYDGIKLFNKFNAQKENERQKRIDQVVKVQSNIKKKLEKEYQLIDYKAKQIQSRLPSLPDLVSPKYSVNDLSQIEACINNQNKKQNLIQSSLHQTVGESELTHFQPYLNQNENTSIQKLNQGLLQQSFPSINNLPQIQLKDLSKQKLFMDIKKISKKKRNIYNQLANSQSSSSLENQLNSNEQPKHQKAKKKVDKLEIIFDYFFEQTPLLNKVFSQRDHLKPKPILSKSIESNNRITNQIISSFTSKGDQSNQNVNISSFNQEYIIPTISNQAITSRKDLGYSNILNNQSNIQSLSTNNELSSYPQKEIIPTINNINDEQTPYLKVLLYGNQNLVKDDNLLKKQSQNQEQQYHAHQNQERKSQSKEKNIHVEKLKKQNANKSLNVKQQQEISSKSDLQQSGEIKSFENINRSRNTSLQKQNLPPFLSARNSLGQVKQNILSAFTSLAPQNQQINKILNLEISPSCQSPINLQNGLNHFVSPRGFAAQHKIFKKQ